MKIIVQAGNNQGNNLSNFDNVKYKKLGAEFD